MPPATVDVLRVLAEIAQFRAGVVADASGAIRAEVGDASEHLRALGIVEAARADRRALRRIASRPPGFSDVLALRLDDAQIALVARGSGDRNFSAAERSALADLVAAQPPPAPAQPRGQDAARRRAPIRAYVTDLALRVQSTAMPDPFDEWRDDVPARTSAGGLPAVIEDAVREALAGWDPTAPDPREQIAFPLPSLVVRIVPLWNGGATGLALFLERLRGAVDLEASAKRFRISARELSVARLLIEGASLDEVSQRLEIAAPTVAAHVRSLIVKTGARRRAEMIARLLGW